MRFVQGPPLPGARQVVTVRGSRNRKPCYARDIKVVVYPAAHDVEVDPAAVKYRYAMCWNARQRIDDGTETGSPIREQDVLMWEDVFPGQELGLADVRADVGAFTLMTAYFFPVDTGQGSPS